MQDYFFKIVIVKTQIFSNDNGTEGRREGDKTICTMIRLSTIFKLI